MITSVDELCAAAEALLKAHLDAVVVGLGYQQLGAIKTWQQLPVTEAISTANLPAIAVTSPGLVEPPTISQANATMTATWSLAIGVYARGHDHQDTQARVRDWCAAVRTTFLTHKSIDDIAQSTQWIGERFELFPAREVARTFGAGVVSFDVTVEMPLNPIDPAGAGGGPTVTSTPSTVTIR